MFFHREFFLIFALAFEQGRIIFSELLKRFALYGVAYALGERIIKIQIVHDRQPACKLLACLEKMSDIGA